MSSQVTIRQAIATDAAGIARVHVESWQHAYRDLLPQAFLDELSIEARTRFWHDVLTREIPKAVTLVSVVDHRVAGFCSCGPTDDATLPDTTSNLAAIYVDPGMYRRGIGRALMDAAVAHLCEQGFTAAILWVLIDNERGRRFYDTYGWRPDGATRTESIGATTVTELRYHLDITNQDHP